MIDLTKLIHDANIFAHKFGIPATREYQIAYYSFMEGHRHRVQEEARSIDLGALEILR